MRTQLRFVAPIPVALAALLLPLRTASAQECQADADCGANAVCDVEVATACPGIACPEGQECPTVECVPTEYRYCRALPCTADADCGEGKVCAPFTETSCSGGGATPACAPDMPCDPVEPVPVEPTCTETTVSYCVYPHELPCTANADCGEGFLCKQMEMCGCSGSAGTDSGSADGGAFAPPPPECFCEPTGEFYCAAAEITCSADSDCPADWTCEASWVSGGCTMPADGTEPVCTETTGPSLCQPPYSSYGGPIYAQDGSATGGGEATGDPTGPSLPPSEPTTNSGDPGTGGDGTVEEGGEDPLPTPSPSNTSEDAGGCSVSRTGGSSDLGVLSLLAGLVVLGRRLRRR